jgi:MSHA biogenesis protein MshJ
MKSMTKKLEAYIDGLSKRDQISLAIIVFVVVVMIWFKAFYMPLSNNLASVKDDLGKSDANLVVAKAKMSALQKSMAQDPDRENKQILAQYIQDGKNLDMQLAKTSTEIITPQEMVKLLEQMLKDQSGLKFISLKNKPATPEFTEAGGQSDKKGRRVSSIYRHSVVLQVEGSYHSALAYMQKLEKLPWKFYWQGVEIETKKYPNSIITFEVYTLGFREGLIGV